jgi:hypothetical protein
MLLVRWLSLHELAHSIAAPDMAARRMASSEYEAHVLEPEDLPKMGCSEGAGDEGHEEAHVATSIHYELHRILLCFQNQMKSPVELRLICRESADRTTFSTSNFPMAQMIHVGPQCGLLARSALGAY